MDNAIFCRNKCINGFSRDSCPRWRLNIRSIDARVPERAKMAHLSANCVHDFSTLRNHRVYRGVCGGRSRGYRGWMRHSPPIRFASRRPLGFSRSREFYRFSNCVGENVQEKKRKTITITSNDDDGLSTFRALSRFIRPRRNPAYENAFVLFYDQWRRTTAGKCYNV